MKPDVMNLAARTKAVRWTGAWLACASLVGCGGAAVSPDAELADEIVGGTTTTIATHPWQITLQDTTGFHFCGGSIIAPSWILTAAHCVVDTAASDLIVVAGTTRLSRASSGQQRGVDRVIVYPGYVTSEDGKDAALLHLASPLDLSGANARAITIATPDDEAAGLTAPGVSATVTGWGSTSERSSATPDTLRQVAVPLVSIASASRAYGMTITADQLPAGVGGKDSCQGDSGGPLTVAKGSGRILAGIVSWGEGCARPGIPGLYGRVASFASWVQRNVSATPSTPSTGASCTTKTIAASGTPLSIPDASPTGVSSVISVSGLQTVSSARISLDIAHTYRGDLVVSLQAPSGAISVISSRAGGSAHDLVLSGAALSGLGGEGAEGTWKLTVQDLEAQDVGTLRSWSLELTGDCH